MSFEQLEKVPLSRRTSTLRSCTALSLVSLLLVAGCGKAAAPAASVPPAEEKHDPVKVTIGIKASGYLTEAEFKRYITDPVQKKYPWITTERVIYTNNNLTEIVARGDTPDLIVSNNINGFPQLAELGLLDSMDDLIKKHGLDLKRFEDGALDAIKLGSKRQELVALPYSRSFAVLYYSKEIFDKFAVAYPKDGMTWQQAAELAKKVTRLDNGVQYRGLDPNVAERLGAQLSLAMVDSKTNRTLINTDPWKKVVSLMGDIYSIPGNGSITVKSAGAELLGKKKTLAMLPEGNILFGFGLDESPDMWDMVTIPVWPEAPKIGMSPDEQIMVLSKTSKHRDDAMRVLSVVLSDEVQTDMSKNGRTSIMKDPEIQAAFAQDLAFMKGKNIQAIFKTQMANYEATLYDTAANNGLAAAVKSIVTQGKDVNTALREAEESVNKKIDETLRK
ncbi:ABC transporter substrate-binding protein [Paenibacillus mesophilus]|uniref:ABC transporter substrate-binding protein n=1 Tax=Paenibacillus mesophilus TaxID=2582849 RepID=UPI0013052C60|nr:extracellular solute-binding protein [Paenibacillus mesophilus]